MPIIAVAVNWYFFVLNMHLSRIFTMFNRYSIPFGRICFILWLGSYFFETKLAPSRAVLILLAALFLFPLLTMMLSRLIPNYFFNNSPLRQSIMDTMDGGVPIAKVIITTAVRKYIFDPDDPSYDPHPFNPISIIVGRLEGRGVRWILGRRSLMIPEYHYINTLEEPATIDVLLATSALPFGLVAPVKIGREMHVDGSRLADNLPFYPSNRLVSQNCDCESRFQ